MSYWLRSSNIFYCIKLENGFVGIYSLAHNLMLNLTHHVTLTARPRSTHFQRADIFPRWNLEPAAGFRVLRE